MHLACVNHITGVLFMNYHYVIDSLIRLLSHIMPLSTNGLSRLCPNPKCCSPEKRTYILKYLLTMQCPYYHLEITGSSNKFFFTSFIKNTLLMPEQKRDMVSVNCLKWNFHRIWKWYSNMKQQQKVYSFNAKYNTYKIYTKYPDKHW